MASVLDSSQAAYYQVYKALVSVRCNRLLAANINAKEK
jgi:hypothetical protein